MCCVRAMTMFPVLGPVVHFKCLFSRQGLLRDRQTDTERERVGGREKSVLCRPRELIDSCEKEVLQVCTSPILNRASYRDRQNDRIECSLFLDHILLVPLLAKRHDFMFVGCSIFHDHILP
ncbi:unnamed protein product [Discosporangium mesarthrocarpum]